MTISSIGAPFQKFQSNGGSTYTFSFQPLPVENGSSVYGVNVYVWDGTSTSGYVLKTQGAGADYTVSVVSSASESGQIVFKVPVPTGQTILIESSLPYTQIVSFPGNAPISPTSVETALDRLELQIRQLKGFLNETIRLEHPSIYGNIKLLVDGNVTDGATVFWEKDTADPTIFRLKTSDFAISQLKTLVDDIDKIKVDVDAALAAARAANDSAIIAANNAAASAQAATNTVNALQQIEAAVQVIKGQVNDILLEVEALKSDVIDIKTETQTLKDQTNTLYDNTKILHDEVVAISTKFPDNTGRGAGFTYVTKADDSIELKPYFNPVSLVGQPAGRKLLTDGLGGIISERDGSAVSNLNTAKPGDILIIGSSPDGNIVVAGPYVASTASISTTDPSKEGGVTVNESLIWYGTRLDALESQANAYPFGEQNVVVDFRVLASGILRNFVDQYVLAPTNTAIPVAETFGKVLHYSTNANYQMPSQKDNKDIFKAQRSIVFSLYVDSTASVPAVVLQNAKLSVQVNLTNMTVTYDGRSLTIPLVLNEWRMYCLSFNDLTLKAFIASYSAGNIAIDDTVAPLALAAPLSNDFLKLTAEDTIRASSLMITSVALTKDEFEENARAFFGLGKASSANIVPDPTTGVSGQVPTISGSSYVLKYPILIDDLPTGWNVQNKISASTELTSSSEYNVFLQVDATGKVINAKVRNTQPAVSVRTTFYTGTISAIPTILAPRDLNVKYRTIQNLSDVDITFGAQADLTVNPLKGYTLASRTSIQTFVNDSLYVTAPAGSVISANSIRVVDEVTATPGRQVSAVTTLPAPPTGSVPVPLVSANNKVSRRIVQNNSTTDVTIGSQQDLIADRDRGFQVVAFDIGVSTATNQDLYVTKPDVGTVNVDEIRVFEEVEA